MTVPEVQKKLFALQDLAYRDFQSPLIPNFPLDYFIGVRTPDLKNLAKELFKNFDCSEFMTSVPHQYFDENQLHAFLLSQEKDFSKCLSELELFLPQINNWATSDQLSPVVFKKHKSDLLPQIQKWIESDKTYTIRFGIKCLMQHFLDECFTENCLEMVAACCRPHLKNADDNYYINMMVSWYFATALAKQWDSAFNFLKNGRLNQWCLKKTVQKARESFRITKEQKEILKNQL
ncbi:MAG: DNA alkylation repair protein [Treponema sp.]|nr:DNA alkylation repair protein [Candidatus Treponema equifaecale]